MAGTTLAALSGSPGHDDAVAIAILFRYAFITPPA
jgi:hypothetical protein